MNLLTSSLQSERKYLYLILSTGTSSNLGVLMRNWEIYCTIKAYTYEIVFNCILPGISSDVS